MSNLGYFVVGLGLLAGYLVAMAAVLFGAAGTLAVPMFWAYLVLFAVLCLTASAAVYLLSPDLVKERVRPGDGEQDRVTVPALKSAHVRTIAARRNSTLDDCTGPQPYRSPSKFSA